MRITSWLLEKPIAVCMVLLLASPIAGAAPLPGQEAATVQDATPVITQQGSSTSQTTTQSPGGRPTVPDNPAPAAGAGGSSGQSAPSKDSQGSSAASQTGGADATSPTQDQSGPAKPVGTAAAPAVKGTGVAGSRVSGAAIAPAKQRRVHIILIRVAVVVAACVAVGTVVALTHATPSQPR